MSSVLEDDFLPAEPTGRLGREELREDVPAALRYAAILLVVGLPLGALWALLAPVVHVVALPGAGIGSPAGEADHAFDAVAIHVLLVASFGVIAGAVAWRRRHRRGPVMLIAVVLGSLAGAWVAGRVGALLAWAASPVPVLVDPAALGSAAPAAPVPAVMTSLPPSPGPWWIALIAGLGAALAYVLAAIVDGHEDMSRDDTA
ncbi:hypothetical protein Acsp06_35180 [Actinomycetospora sp. NBRC 106375]|uniref:DUF2567 domain-containing protein n=1 Tax=Actinomycetospora sp. NBRC 106375 TaxID=3032207 RepID=UPI0024A22B6A|nr:DUF2567 domain-containing protein [Actinomycetospora sp. NBRC 106375]GLZ47333.1 hypothetical protein Acsp06_35180 [Actinomycetospora sp. NBRC 106375]